MSVSAPFNATARLPALLATARARARTTRRRVLVSMAERIAPVDPLAALEGIAEAARAGAIAVDSSERMYWARPADSFSLAGIGAVIMLGHRGADRFAAIDREWSTLRADAIVDDPSDGAPGVGPLLAGGFSFEPDGPRSERWRDFPAARLFLPRIQLAATGDEHWLTLNLLVAPNGEPDVDPHAVGTLRDLVIDGMFASERDGDSDDAGGATLEVLARAGVDREPQWRAMVGDAIGAIRDGVLEKVVLARELRVTAPRELDPVATLRQLLAAHQGGFVFGCWHGESAFVGATPELLVSVEGDRVLASSLAGSVSRGATEGEDAALAAALLDSAKDRVEHEFVRGALCAGMEQLCDDVEAAPEPSLLSLPNVHHLHTAVTGRLRPGGSLLGLVARLHPTPAVGGEPREAALRFIREHEGIDRGWYAAPIGWLQQRRGEFAVALRCALLTGSEALLFAGCGIVADSDPAEEYAESSLKLRPMEMALACSVVDAGSGVGARDAAAVRGGR
jgi:salicylate biosynthesis isochorismate synthase